MKKEFLVQDAPYKVNEEDFVGIDTYRLSLAEEDARSGTYWDEKHKVFKQVLFVDGKPLLYSWYLDTKDKDKNELMDILLWGKFTEFLKKK
jgi:hypothetical protein